MIKLRFLLFTVFTFIFSCSDLEFVENNTIVEIPEIDPCICAPIFTDDRDGKVYRTVWIDEDGGNDLNKNGQCWMRDNLNYDLQAGETGQKYCYDASDFNCNNYGGLYNWSTAMQDNSDEKTRGICPEGWHIPTEQEFDRLLVNIGHDDAESKLTFGMPNAINSSNFSALMAGRRRNEIEYIGHFLYLQDFPIGAKGYFWTSTTVDEGERGFRIQYESFGNSALTATYTPSTFLALSIRCVCGD